MTKTTISQAEWIAAFENATKAHPQSDDACSIAELSSVWKCGERVARNRLRELIASGVAEVVHVQRKNLIGTMTTVAAYRLKKQKGKA